MYWNPNIATIEIAEASTPMLSSHDKAGDLKLDPSLWIAIAAARPSYLQDLRGRRDVNHFTFEFEDVTLVDQPDAKDAMPRYQRNGDQSGTCTFNNLTYVKGEPLLTMHLNEVQEWYVSGVQAHPLHVHVNPMQLQRFLVDGAPWTASRCDPEYSFFCEGDWVDTLQLPHAVSVSGAVVRFIPTDFAGDMVVHCHYLIHEDQGCLTYVNVVDNEQPSKLVGH